MSRYIALLRGVNNIGASTRVSMADLRMLFEKVGFRDVRTVLNSGNVVFSVPDGRQRGIPGRISAALAGELNVTPQVIVLTAREVASAVAENPFPVAARNPSSLLIVALARPSDRDRLNPLLTQRWAPEKLALGRRVAYLWCARGVADSRLWPAVDRALGRRGTARNLATMARLARLEQGRGQRAKVKGQTNSDRIQTLSIERRRGGANDGGN